MNNALENPLPDDELNRPLVPFADGLPAEVEEARRKRNAVDAEMRATYEPRIEAHLDMHRRAIRFLDETHRWVADRIDFDLKGDTRLVALWQMAGRCIGIARLILDSLALGYTAEVMHLGRAVHEANRLLNVFHLLNEDALLRRWLAGKYVSPGECRQAEERFDKHLARVMLERGEEPMSTVRGEKSRTMYSDLSEAAHHRRRWTEDAVFPDERMMLTGPTGDFYRRAATAARLLLVVEETVIGVGDAISQVVPQTSWYESNVQPYLDGFESLREGQPLP